METSNNANNNSSVRELSAEEFAQRAAQVAQMEGSENLVMDVITGEVSMKKKSEDKEKKYYPPNPNWCCSVCDKSDDSNSKTMKTCGRCKAVQYCSRECQKADWKEHKKKCGKHGEGCYEYIPSWGVSIHWLSLKERIDRFAGLNAYGWSYEEALGMWEDYDYDFYFLKMVDDEREDEDRSCYEGGDDDDGGEDDRLLVPYWKSMGYSSVDECILDEIDGVRNLEEFVCDYFGVPRLMAIGENIDKKFEKVGLKYLGYKPGRDYEIDHTSVKIGSRVFMSGCSGHAYCEKGYYSHLR